MIRRATCRVCGDDLPEPKPTGRPRLYCPQSKRPCRKRHVAIAKLRERAIAYEARGDYDLASIHRRRAEVLRESWRAPAQSRQ